MTILLIEQNAKLALECSQRGYVMESGEITLHGESASCSAIPRCAPPIWANSPGCLFQLKSNFLAAASATMQPRRPRACKTP
jgi:energy-coupling factor transporter ATP-binding protein EcfA2